MPHCGKTGSVVALVLLHGVDGIGHKKLGIKPVLLGHKQVPCVHQGRPAPQDLHHQLAGPRGEEEARAPPPEGVATEEVRVEASFPQDRLQSSRELGVVDEPLLAGVEGEGWSIWWCWDPL